MMQKIVVLQALATLFTALIVAIVTMWFAGTATAGLHAAISATLGGAACVVPNLLFMVRLMARSGRPGAVNAPNPASFLVGEFVKLFLTVAALFLIASFYRDLDWLALLVGMIVSLKSYLVFLLIERRI